MINYIWFVMILAGTLGAALKGDISLVTTAIINGAEQAVAVAIGLIGIISFWSGMMRIAQDAGLIDVFARIMQPVAKVLFPEIPKNHPAIGAILLSMSANLLGLGNACTPLGIKAMEEMQSFNRDPDVASNSMCTFLAITASSLTLVPATIIAFRAVHGSVTPTEIIGTTIVTTACSTLIAIISDRILRKFS